MNNVKRPENYADCDDLKGITVDRLEPVRGINEISLSKEFGLSPVKSQRDYLHNLASSLNNAVDIMQRERNEVIRLCAAQEAQIKKLIRQTEVLGETIQQYVASTNETANMRAKENQELKSKIRKLEDEAFNQTPWQ